MKPQQFIYTVKEATRPRRTGGLNYTVQVYEIKNGETIHLGERSACTHAHKGEISEAWTVVIKSKRLRPSIIKRMKAETNKNINPFSYYTYTYEKDYNVKLQRVG